MSRHLAASWLTAWISLFVGCGEGDRGAAVVPPALISAPATPVDVEPRVAEEASDVPEVALLAGELPAPDPRARWLGVPFRCRAISTTRLRSCRMEQRGDAVSITFPVADLRCDRVTFDEQGDPIRLEECRSTWLRVPATIDLGRAPGSETWSGSHSGWRWRDGGQYCCPGVWIVAPSVDVSALDPVDADHEVPPPKPPRDRRRRDRDMVLPG